jgi:hypothetical protein
MYTEREKDHEKKDKKSLVSWLHLAFVGIFRLLWRWRRRRRKQRTQYGPGGYARASFYVHQGRSGRERVSG